MTNDEIPKYPITQLPKYPNTQFAKYQICQFAKNEGMTNSEARIPSELCSCSIEILPVYPNGIP